MELMALASSSGGVVGAGCCSRLATWSLLSNTRYTRSSSRDTANANRRFDAAPAMPTAWETRLDGRGYHATSVKRVDTAARWQGATRTAEDGFVDGDTLVAFDPDDESKQLLVAKGDAVYLSGARKGQPAEIGLIHSLFQCPRGFYWLECNWFWRPERLKLKDEVEWHSQELFLQTGADPDENSASAIELTKVVVSELSDPNVVDVTEAPHATELKERVAALEAGRAADAARIAALNSELAARIDDQSAEIAALADAAQCDILLARISTLENTMETKLMETAAKIMEQTAQSKLAELLARVKELEMVV